MNIRSRINLLERHVVVGCRACHGGEVSQVWQVEDERYQNPSFARPVGVT